MWGQFIKIRKAERLPACLFLLWQIIMQATVIVPYYSVFSVVSSNYRKNFLDWFHVSGFDPLTYCVVTDWSTAYDVHRHPLLAFFYYPLYLINHGLTSLLGVNCVQFLVAFVLLISSFYAFLLMMRIGKDLLHLSQRESAVIAFLLFSFAYVLLAAVSPDHFILSLFLLLLVIYITGKQMAEGKPLKKKQAIILFLLTAGVSLNNGLKVFLADFFSKGKRFFRPYNLILVVVLPAVLIWFFGAWEYKTFVADSVKERKMNERQAVKKDKTKLWTAFCDTTRIKDNKQQKAAFDQLWKRHRQAQLKVKYSAPRYAHSGDPVSKQPFLNWTDITTSRSKTIVENLFGESLQLHQSCTLGDVMRDRPVFVSYNWFFNYVIEAFIVLLFLCGIWAGKRSKLMWMTLSFFALDMILHIGLGFGINEVYIMTAHWAYVIPLCIGFLIKSTSGRKRTAITLFTALIAFYLIVYNSVLTIFTL